MLRFPRVAWMVFFLMSAGAASGETEAGATDAVFEISPPVQMLRTLQLMQDQIAAGSTEAHLGQRGLVTVLDERFLGLPDETWKHTRNVRAAVAFVLSGGRPEILRKMLSPRLVSLEDLPLVEGSLAYVEGREEEAKKALLGIDPMILPTGLGAQMALVQATLLVRTDPQGSMKLLDLVRLLVPGTLLEESALRRQVFVASQLDEARTFEALVSEYLNRYRHSVYAANFRQRLAAALTRIDFGKDPERFVRTLEALRDLDVAVEVDLLLMIARSSLEQGWLKSALLASEKSLALLDSGSNHMRARLYRAASMIASPRTLEVGLHDMKSIDRAVLPVQDVALLDSALAMARQITHQPGDPVDPVKVVAAPAARPRDAQATDMPPVISKAQEALQRVDRLFKH
jgi:chemotaxis protein MotC